MVLDDRLSIAIRIAVVVIDEINPSKKLIEFIVGLLKNAQLGLKNNSCSLCSLIGNRSSENIEEHHIAGRRNYDDTISVCKECHYFLSGLQLMWRIPKFNEHRISSYFFGWSDIFHFLWDNTQDHFFYKLHRQFAYQGGYYRKAYEMNQHGTY